MGAPVQSVHGIVDGIGATVAASAFTSVNVGDTISGQVTWQDAGTTTLSISDGTANVYTVVDQLLLTGFRQATFYCKTTVGGSLTLTATVTSTNFKRIQARQDTGLGTLDKHAINASATFGTGTDACTSTAQITTVACTVLGFYYDNSAATLPTAGTGATLRDGFTNAAGDALAMDDKVQGAAGSVAATFTTTAGTDQIYVGMLAFQPAAALSPGAIPQPGPGVSPSTINTFRPAARAITPLSPDVTLSITGVQATVSAGAVGAVGGDYRAGLIPQPGPGIGPFNNGQFIAAPRAVLSGSAPITLALTGVQATASAGVPVAALSAPISGNQGTTGVGSLSPAVSYGLTGAQATTAAGVVSPGADQSAALTGVAATTGVGSVVASISYALTGVGSTAQAGALSSAVSVAVSGSQASASAGALQSAVSIPVLGAQATTAAGAVSPSGGDVTRALTGAQATVLAGSVIGPVGSEVNRLMRFRFRR